MYFKILWYTRKHKVVSAYIYIPGKRSIFQENDPFQEPLFVEFIHLLNVSERK